MNDVIIIGNSKTAKALFSYLKYKSIKSRIIPYRKYQLYLNLIKKAKIIFILTKDDEIINFYNSVKEIIHDKKLFHFSGTIYHPAIISLHPIFSFSSKPDKNEFKKIIFTSENPQHVRKTLNWFKNKIIKIPKNEKPYYHCLLTILLNFPLILINETLPILNKKFKIPKKYLKNLIKKNIENYFKTGYITGPITRKDKKTIYFHLKKMKSKKLKELYLAFLKLKNIKELI